MKIDKGSPRRRGAFFGPDVPAEALRPLADFTDAELLRHGMVLKYKHAQHLDRNGLGKGFEASWKDLCREWSKRFPELPLRATFDGQLVSLTPSMAPIEATRR